MCAHRSYTGPQADAEMLRLSLAPNNNSLVQGHEYTELASLWTPPTLWRPVETSGLYQS
jgi:hypothetical protein